VESITHNRRASSASERAKARMRRSRFEPLFIADWEGVLMIHFAVNAGTLQRDVPFQLDLRDGQAFVTLVAFTMRDLRPALGGSLTSWLFRPIATHDFLNVRTYVRVGDEVGIHFLAEWVSNRLAVKLGPGTFSLPYRHGRIEYQNDWQVGALHGRVADFKTDAAFEYRAELAFDVPFVPCEPGSLDEWLMERYTAFNAAGGRKRFFRVWHEPWAQSQTDVVITDTSLLEANWNWFRDAKFVGANYSAGVHDVWLGRPHSLSLGRCRACLQLLPSSPVGGRLEYGDRCDACPTSGD
jgi:uncharacterized protein YqjF (DUF2071 family)